MKVQLKAAITTSHTWCLVIHSLSYWDRYCAECFEFLTSFMMWFLTFFSLSSCIWPFFDHCLIRTVSLTLHKNINLDKDHSVCNEKQYPHNLVVPWSFRFWDACTSLENTYWNCFILPSVCTKHLENMSGFSWNLLLVTKISWYIPATDSLYEYLHVFLCVSWA